MIKVGARRSFANKSISTTVAPSLTISDPNYVCNQCVSGQTGRVLVTATHLDGFIDMLGNSYTGLTTNALTTINSSVSFRNNQITAVSFPALTSGGIDLWGNPLTSASFPVFQTTGGQHLYLAHIATLTTMSLPALTTMDRAVVLSQDYNLTSFSAPLLVTISHELELDYTWITTLSLPALTTINLASSAGILGAGDPRDIGLIPSVCPITTLSLPSLTSLLGQITIPSGTISTVDISALTTLGNGFIFNLNRNSLSVAGVNAILVKLNASKGSVTSGTIDLRFQNPSGAIPTGAGATAKAALQGVGITVLTD